MNGNKTLDTLIDYLSALDAVSVGLHEAFDAMPERPMSFSYFIRFTSLERMASRAFLKTVEQLQDLLSKTIRLALLLEDEDLTGLSARAVADRAESIGLIGSADRWSALVRLRNRLVHEYPLTPEQQFDRFHEVWREFVGLLAVRNSVLVFLREHKHIGDDDG